MPSTTQSCSYSTGPDPQFLPLSPDSVPIRVDEYPLLFVVATVTTFMRLFAHVVQCKKLPSHPHHIFSLQNQGILVEFPRSDASTQHAFNTNSTTRKHCSTQTLHTPPTCMRSDFLSVKNVLLSVLSAATDIMHLTDHILYVPPDLPYFKKQPRPIYSPSFILSIKGKSLPYGPPDPISSLATREIGSNGAHLWKKHC